MFSILAIVWKYTVRIIFSWNLSYKNWELNEKIQNQLVLNPIFNINT